MNVADPIGVFDSGVGGLSVLREIRRELPHENLLYVADSDNAPYGNKSRQLIEMRSIAIAEFLLNRQAKAIVVACNTATGAAATALRARFPLPIIAMEPAVKPAAKSTRSGVVGVLATRNTLASDNFVKLFARYRAEVDILVQPCPGLVERVEAGDLTSARTRSLLGQYLHPLLDRGADTIVLGCTHYPFLSPLIQVLAGPAVAVIDSSAAVARELRRRLESNGLLSGATLAGNEQFWTSGAPAEVTAVISQLWRADVEVHGLPSASAGADLCFTGKRGNPPHQKPDRADLSK